VPAASIRAADDVGRLTPIERHVASSQDRFGVRMRRVA
jgi:hypothetical protein